MIPTWLKRRREAEETAREQRAMERAGVVFGLDNEAVPELPSTCSACWQEIPAGQARLDGHGGQRCPACTENRR